MKRIFRFILMFFYVMTYSQTVIYEESQDILFNPERGWQKYSEAKSSNYQLLTQNILNLWKNSSDKVSVVYRYFYLDQFVNSQISSSYLDKMTSDFQAIRASGFKVIVRFAYTDNINQTQPQPIKSRIIQHIQQVASILNENIDVIYTLQLGWIGVWGEWYYTNESQEFGHQGSISPAQFQNRKEVVDAFVNSVPNGYFQLRYPEHKKIMYGSNYLGSIGFYNDSAFNSWGDMGTFPVSSECQMPSDQNIMYLAHQTTNLPMTGETNGFNQCSNGLRTTCANVTQEMQLFNYSTLNRDFYIPVINQWQNQGCYDEITKRLGYRLKLNQVDFSINQNIFTATLNITNLGYARVVKPKKVLIVLRNENNGELIKFDTSENCLNWAVDHTFTTSCDLNTIPEATYDVFLEIKDILNNDLNYNIRLANVNLWNQELGINSLDFRFTKNNLSIPKYDFFKTEFDNLMIYDMAMRLICKTKECVPILKGLYFVVATKEDKKHLYKIVF